LLPIPRVDMQTMTLYAELFEQLQMMEASRTIADLKGSFATREVNGENYVYFLHYLPGGKLHQVYVGKKGSQTDALIQQYEEGKRESQEARENLRRLAAQVQAGTAFLVDKAMSRVIGALAEAAVFRSGAVLIGTHAFRAIGLMLGVRWFPTTMMTMDVDLAAERTTVAVALPPVQADIPAVIDSLKMGFFAVPAMNLKYPSTTFAIRKSQLRLELLTPKTTKSDDPVVIPRFNCAAQPLSFLSYLIEHPIPAVLLDTDPVLINVPQPVRYAMHKLIVSQVRDISKKAKAEKDLHQAFLLLTILKEERPDDVPPAWEDLVSRGPKWKKLAEAGLAAMEKRYGSKVIEELVVLSR